MNEQLVFTVVDTTPFKEGKAAGEKNIQLDVRERFVNDVRERFVNPYPQGSNEWVDWICGYNQAICML